MPNSKIIVVHFKSSLSRGGAERQILTLYKYYNRGKHDLKILYLNEHANNSYLNEYRIEKSDLIRVFNKNVFARLWNIYKALKKINPDVLFCWGNFEFLLSFPYALLNRKVTLVNGSIRHGILSLKASHILRFIVLHFSKIVIANSCAGLRANRIRNGFILYNGIDKKFENKLDQKDKIFLIKKFFPNYHDEVLLVSVANFYPYKDYLTILLALKKVLERGFNFYYIILGDGPLRQAIESEIVRLGLQDNIHIVGRVKNVQDYLKISDIMVHSSKGEGCSNSILEAMFSSLPIIASRVGGIPEYVDNDNGALFDYKNIGQLTSALEKLLGDINLRKRMGDASYQRVKQNFTVDKMMDRYYEIVQRIMAK